MTQETSGRYVVSVTTDRNGTRAEAEGEGNASVNGYHAEVTVNLDLLRLSHGTYYLATTHEGDQASYFYPLIVQ